MLPLLHPGELTASSSVGATWTPWPVSLMSRPTLLEDLQLLVQRALQYGVIPDLQ